MKQHPHRSLSTHRCTNIHAVTLREADVAFVRSAAFQSIKLLIDFKGITEIVLSVHSDLWTSGVHAYTFLLSLAEAKCVVGNLQLHCTVRKLFSCIPSWGMYIYLKLSSWQAGSGPSSFHVFNFLSLDIFRQSAIIQVIQLKLGWKRHFVRGKGEVKSVLNVWFTVNKHVNDALALSDPGAVGVC